MKFILKKGASLALALAFMLSIMPLSFAASDGDEAGFTKDEISIMLKNKAGDTVPVAGANIHITGGVVEEAEFLLVGDQTTDENGEAKYNHTYRMSVKYTITLPGSDYDFVDEYNKYTIFGGSTQFHNVFSEMMGNERDLVESIDSVNLYKDGDEYKLEFRVGIPEDWCPYNDAPLAGGTSFIRILLTEKPNPENNPNFFIVGDDTYDVWIDGINQFTGLPIQVTEEGNLHSTNYTEVNEYYYPSGFDYDTLVAIKGEDIDGTANIAGIKAMYSYDDGYGGTDGTWACYVGEPPVYEDVNGNTIYWYENGYKSNGAWVPVTVIDDIDPQWNISDWPDGEGEEGFIWSENYKYSSGDKEGEQLIDTPVYFRNVRPEGYGRLTVTKKWVGVENEKDRTAIVNVKFGDTIKHKLLLKAENNYTQSIDLPNDVDCVITVEEEPIEGFITTYSPDNEVIFNKSNKCDITVINTKDEKVNVIFDKGAHGSLSGTSSYTVYLHQKLKDVISAPPVVTADSGYTFTGWDPVYDGDKTPLYYIVNDTEVKTLTFVAQYRKNPPDPGPGPGPGPSPGPSVTIPDGEDVPLSKLDYENHFAYIQGYPDGTVRPEGNVTREEVAAIFFRLLNPEYRETIRSMKNGFADVYTSDWSNKHISTLTNGRILKGYSDGTFRPDENVKRGELAAIASRFDKLDVGIPHNFSDLKGHWSEIYVASAVEKGWVNGYPDGTYRPEQYVTRAEFVTFVNNVLDRHVKLEDILDGTKEFTDLKNTQDWYYTPLKIATNSYLYEIVEDQAEEGSTENPDGTVDIDEGETPLGSLVKKTYQKWTELISPIIEM